ncbi:MAG TPA: hypothetical protein VNH44_12240 [Micropepsaceae bacterium]|nr:hypothetical protein [Micropepsaceae bacterium]
MFKIFCCCAAILLAACNPAAIRDNAVKQAARVAAEARFAAACGTVTIPDTAFLPVDITSGGHDFVLSFARAVCAQKPDLWFATAGSLFQLWIAEGDTPRMALEQHLDGFRHDYKSAVLITDQRGPSCKGAAGQAICRIVYRWEPAVRALVIVDRQSAPAEPLPVPGLIARSLPRRSAALSGDSHRPVSRTQ